MEYLLIDADTGIDDSIAILYALSHPEARVLGITTGFGNTTAAQGAENTLRLIRLAAPDYTIPVAIGAEAPLAGGSFELPTHIHGDNGIGNVELPASDQKAEAEDAAAFLIRKAKEMPGEITLVTLGRFTNLALALEKEPQLPKLLKRVVAMGGTVEAPGNISPVAEANIWGDPEAADLVFAAGFPLTVVGLDVTSITTLSKQQVEDLAFFCTGPREKQIYAYLQEALTFYMEFNRRQDRYYNRCPLHDPLAMMVALDPSLVKSQKRVARVECGGSYCRGMIVTDRRPQPIEGHFVEFCLEVESSRAVEQLLAAFATKDTPSN